MSDTFGKNITLTVFGESHGAEIGCVLSGLAPGIEINNDFISKTLKRRQPQYGIGTERCEADEYRIVSGVYEGATTGDALTIIIKNTDIKESAVDYGEIPRPGHADFSSLLRSEGFADLRSGGHLSGRLTAPITAAGAILLKALSDKGIAIKSEIAKIGGIKDFDVACEAIKTIKEKGDSLGGIIRTTVDGMPAGLGEPYFDSIESLISHAVFSIPGVKGIEFGDGFKAAEMLGSEFNDALGVAEDGSLMHLTNHSGGINGGITNGAQLVFNTVIRPTASIAKAQQSVNLKTGELTTLKVDGRHDPCIVPRAGVILEAVTALVIADVLTGRYGRDFFLD